MITPISITTDSSRTYRIELPVQTENGIYHFQIVPTIVDARGYQFNRTRMAYLANLMTFTHGIWWLTPSRLAGRTTPLLETSLARSSVDIWFSEKIDKTTLSTADVASSNRTVRPSRPPASRKSG